MSGHRAADIDRSIVCGSGRMRCAISWFAGEPVPPNSQPPSSTICHLMSAQSWKRNYSVANPFSKSSAGTKSKRRNPEDIEAVRVADAAHGSAQSQRKGAVAPCSWTPQESKVECCEHQDDSNIHGQPFPESVSEEHDIYTDYDGYHRHHVKHVSYRSAHFSSH